MVLVEGRSDVAAVRRLAARRGITGLDLVDMGGITNVRRELQRSLPGPVLGLCDADQVGYVQRGLAHFLGIEVTEQDLATHGWFVCHDDLEEELIRAVGTERCLEVVTAMGDAGSLASFRSQPEWRGRPLADQLHRFAGTRSGRKQALAAALADDVPLERVPAPLTGLIARIETLTGG